MTGATLENNHVRMFLPRVANSEMSVRSRIETNVTDRTIRALRCGFAAMSATQGLAGLMALTYDVSAQAMTPNNFQPDMALYDLTPSKRISPNRAPGDIKPSY